MRAANLFFVLLGVCALCAPLLGIYPVFMMKLLCFALFACAFNLLLGFTKMLSFGHAAYFGSSAYVTGWLVAVHVPDEEHTTRNLVPKGLVREWMRDAAERLYSRQPQFAGAVAADGGRPADDVLAGLPNANWAEVTGEFFLTE